LEREHLATIGHDPALAGVMHALMEATSEESLIE
jgi:hypothetical protein